MGVEIELKRKIIQVTPVIDTAIYASGDQVSNLFELPLAVDDSSGSGVVTSITILDRAVQSLALSLLLFKDKPVITSVLNGALSISDTEMIKCLGVVPVVAGDYVSATACSIATVRNVMLGVSATKSSDNPTGQSLWGILRTGATPTYGAVDALVVSVCISQD